MVNTIQALQNPLAQLTLYKPEVALAFGIIGLVLLSLFKVQSSILSRFINIGSACAYFIFLTQEPSISNYIIHRDSSSYSLIFLLVLGYLLGQFIDYFTETKANPVVNQIAYLSLLLGCVLLPTATNYLSVYLSVEFISISAYFLVASSTKKFSFEGSFKYLIFGGISSSLLLYGISIQYGIQGNLELIQGSKLLIDLPLAQVSGVLILLGLVFKLGGFPMHSWVADVYESSSKGLVATLSIVPKIAALIILSRVIANVSVSSNTVINFGLLIAIIGTTYGNLMAIRQKSVMRLIGYSSVSYSSLLLLIPLAGLSTSGTAAYFLLVAYSLGTIGIIAWVAALPTFKDEIADFSGLAKVQPFAALVLLVLLLNLAGIPPFLGFTGKLLLFGVAYNEYSNSVNILWIVALAVGVINTVVSLAYYLRISYLQFLKEGVDLEKRVSKPNFGLYLISILLAMACIALFLMPEGLTTISK